MAEVPDTNRWLVHWHLSWIGTTGAGYVWTEGENSYQQIVPESKNHSFDARHSFSTVLYLVSCRRSLQLRYSMGCSTTTWDNTAPNPLSDVSICKTKRREKSGECKMSLPHSAAFNWVKACWHGSIHWTGSDVPFLVSSVRGLMTSKKIGTNLQ